MKKAMGLLIAGATLTLVSSAAFARVPLGQARPMTVEIAKQLVSVAKKASCAPPAGQCSGVFAVADDAGVIIYLEAIDGVIAAAPQLAMAKATAAAVWRRPTEVFRKAVDDKRNTSYADGTFKDMTTSPGGIPLFKHGRVVGAIGIAAVGSLPAVKQVEKAVLEKATQIFGRQ